jgi:hypothetical protein
MVLIDARKYPDRSCQFSRQVITTLIPYFFLDYFIATNYQTKLFP